MGSSAAWRKDQRTSSDMGSMMGSSANVYAARSEADQELARRRRERVEGRQTYEKTRQSKGDKKRTLPKHLQNVKSVIKNKVAIDKELGIARRMRGYSKREPEVFVKSPPRQRS